VPGTTTQLELRIGDHERSEAVTFLRRQCAEGRLTLDEFSDRADLVLRARTAQDLRAVLADLPALPPVPAAPARRARRWRLHLSVFSGNRQAGRWRPARHTIAVSVFGSMTLDLREAVVAGPEVAIHAYAVFGSVNVITLEGTELDCSAIAVFGSVGGSVSPTDETSPLLVRLEGVAVFGSISTRVRALRHAERGAPARASGE